MYIWLCVFSFRQNGMGWASMMARVGAMVAPMVLLIADYLPWLPGLIYGGAPILSGVAAIFLPETLGSPLPDTIQDVEDRYDYIYLHVSKSKLTFTVSPLMWLTVEKRNMYPYFLFLF